MLFKGKVALVTGGASGIGLGCIKEMLNSDILGITLVDIDEEAGSKVVKEFNVKYGEGKVIFVKTNVSDKNALEAAFKKTIEVFKQLDIVFNNAGIFDEVGYEKCINVNLIGMIHGLKLGLDHYLPKYKSSKNAVIVNTSSIAGLMPLNSVEIYSTSKFAIVGLTRNFGSDYHYNRTGVKVMAICPGATATPIIEKFQSKAVYKDMMVVAMELAKVENQQSTQDLAKCFKNVVEQEENGSIWVINKGKEYKVEFPKLFEL